MYRPLYMFGYPGNTKHHAQPHAVPGRLPTYSNGNTEATITMKNYKWSNGETVTATDVLFFMNMLHAETANWYDYVPGLFPDNVKSVTVNSPTSITFTFNKAYEPDVDDLQRVLPDHAVPDGLGHHGRPGGAPARAAARRGTYGAASTDAACAKVYNFLAGQAERSDRLLREPVWGDRRRPVHHRGLQGRVVQHHGRR